MTADLKVLVVGRSCAANDADIQVPASEDTVGRKHAEITIDASGGCHIVDLRSKNGTFVREGRGWKKISQAGVCLEDSIRVGDYITTVAQLLSLQRAKPQPRRQEVVSPKQQVKSAAVSRNAGRTPRRNPVTGEIE